MKILFSVLSVILLFSKLYASANIEVPSNYLDMGKLCIINEAAIYEIPLHYWKPDGIIRINKIDLRGIRIHNMIIDGKIAFPINGVLRHSEIFRHDQSKEVDSIGNYYTINMRLRMIPKIQLESEIETREAIKKAGTGLFYETWAEKDGYLKLYWIPYGSKEVYINYSICVLKEKEIKKFDIIEANKTIRIEFEWQ